MIQVCYEVIFIFNTINPQFCQGSWGQKLGSQNRIILTLYGLWMIKNFLLNKIEDLAKLKLIKLKSTKLNNYCSLFTKTL